MNKFIAILLIALLACAMIVSAEEDRTKPAPKTKAPASTTPPAPTAESCQNCKNALETIHSKIPQHPTAEYLKSFFASQCSQVIQTIAGAVPVSGLPQPPISPCELANAHQNPFVQGLAQNQAYSVICQNAGLC